MATNEVNRKLAIWYKTHGGYLHYWYSWGGWRINSLFLSFLEFLSSLVDYPITL